MALLLLTACGVVWFATPRPSRPTDPPSNWALATALPASADFPVGWDYGLTGSLTPRRVISKPANRNPDETFQPAECADSPMDGTGPTGYADIASVGAHPPGRVGQNAPNVGYGIRGVDDAAGMVSRYLDWLDRCGTYRFIYRNPKTGAASETTITMTKIDIDVPDGVDAAAAIVYGNDTSTGPSDIYYAVRGVILDCRLRVHGDDLTLAQRLAGQTARKLAAL